MRRARFIAWLLLGVAAAVSTHAQGLLLPGPRERLVQDCDHCPVMVVLPDGLMISQTPVTRGDFRAYAEATGWKREGWGCDWSFAHIAQTDAHPVVCVSYQDAAGYADWLSDLTGHSYRLPTRAEVRYAALGGSHGNYWWGQSVGVGRANCDGCGGADAGTGTVPVGTYDKNRYNVADAVGNVWIWTNDCATPDCAERYLIGGGWSSSPAALRMDAEIWNRVDAPYNHYGMRVIREGEL
ncbi:MULTISPECIES: formylglycine-generating enzyme family protein [unclassified Meridianimarinicoccus]|uniref:formylglycine-generating enzyme family protein n=1 Tax=unclassified Meridianimarinicoccus TaxID=2923344 RepID=UPI001867EC9A|nr:SUMF1/EgtB/PvdO family nonheme iron enzyme [Fluviibacterium sp. MJW13]